MSYPSRNMQHFIFCPKYRIPMFQDAGRAEQLEKLIRHICQLEDIEILALAVQPDHVHLMVIVPLTMPLSRAMMQVKWFSSIHMRRLYPELKKHKAMWAKHYFQKSVGGGRAEQQKYIDAQMLKYR